MPVKAGAGKMPVVRIATQRLIYSAGVSPATAGSAPKF